MLLQKVATTSTRVAATRSRLQKQRLLADLLRACGPEDVQIVVAYMMGILPQGKIGLGFATIE